MDTYRACMILSILFLATGIGFLIQGGLGEIKIVKLIVLGIFLCATGIILGFSKAYRYAG